MTATLPIVPLAAVLGFAAVLAVLIAAGMCGPARGPARAYLRFAAGLAMALALAELAAGIAGGTAPAMLASAVMALVAALAPTVLALAAAHVSGPPATLPAAAALVAACLCGLVAAATGNVFFAFAPLLLATLALAAQAFTIWPRSQRQALLTGLGALSLLAAASAAMAGGADGPQAFGLFFAAALLGVALAVTRGSDLPVEVCTVKSARKPFFIRGRR